MKNPPHNISKRIIDNQLTIEPPGPAGNLFTLNISSTWSRAADNLFCNNNVPCSSWFRCDSKSDGLKLLEYNRRDVLRFRVDKISP